MTDKHAVNNMLWRRVRYYASLLGSFLILMMTILPVASASPPSKEQLAGTWQGTMTIDNKSTYPLTMTVNTDGTLRVVGMSGAIYSYAFEQLNNTMGAIGEAFGSSGSNRKTNSPNSQKPAQNDRSQAKQVPFRYQDGTLNVDNKLCYVEDKYQYCLTLTGPITTVGSEYVVSGTGYMVLKAPNESDYTHNFSWRVTKPAAAVQSPATPQQPSTAQQPAAPPKGASGLNQSASSAGSVPGLGGVGNVPGPANSTQAIAGVVIPGLITVILGALQGVGGTGGNGTSPNPFSGGPPPIPTGGTNIPHRPDGIYIDAQKSNSPTGTVLTTPNTAFTDIKRGASLMGTGQTTVPTDSGAHTGTVLTTPNTAFTDIKRGASLMGTGQTTAPTDSETHTGRILTTPDSAFTDIKRGASLSGASQTTTSTESAVHTGTVLTTPDAAFTDIKRGASLSGTSQTTAPTDSGANTGTVLTTPESAFTDIKRGASLSGTAAENKPNDIHTDTGTGTPPGARPDGTYVDAKNGSPPANPERVIHPPENSASEQSEDSGGHAQNPPSESGGNGEAASGRKGNAATERTDTPNPSTNDTDKSGSAATPEKQQSPFDRFADIQITHTVTLGPAENPPPIPGRDAHEIEAKAPDSGLPSGGSWGGRRLFETPHPVDGAPVSGQAGEASAAPVPQDGERRTYHGATDGRDYDVQFNGKTGQWVTDDGYIFNPGRFDEWQSELGKDRGFSQNEMDKMSARQTDFDKKMDDMVERQKRQAADLATLGRAQTAAVQQGLWNPGGPGDVVGKIDELTRDVMNGKPLDQSEFEKIKGVIKDRIMGKTAAEGAAREAQHEARDFAGQVTSALEATAREVITGRKDDGSISVLGMAGRVMIGTATSGYSEAVFTPVDAASRAKEAIDREQPGKETSGTLSDLWTATKAAGGAVLDHAIVGDLSRGAGALTQGLANKLPALDRPIAVGIEEVSATAGKAISGRAESAAANTAAAGASGAIDTSLQAQKNALKNALAETDEAKRIAAVKALYTDGGRSKLAQLEQTGHLTAQEAKACNKIITSEVNTAVDAGVKGAMSDFERATGVKIKEVLIGDSGSSARAGKVRSILSDADRTSVPSFNQKSLQAYADQMGITREQAHDRLSKQYAEMMEKKVGEALESRGLSKEAVDYKTYDRIGSNAGQADAYPAGLTNVRQSVGQSTRYAADEAGNIKISKTSGQALLDQEALNRKLVSGRNSAIDEVVAKSTPKEYPGIIKQQVMAVSDHVDPKSTAKALERTQWVAERMGSSIDSELLNVAKKIAKSPQDTSSILANAGMTAEEFHARSFGVIKGFASKMPGA